MANCNTQQLNITCGTDVVLHDRLIFEGETFDPNLSVGIAANLVSSLGKRTALDVQVVDDELLISVPWIDGTLPGCYGLEVTGSCNSKKWATYADSLIKYTKATRIGVSEVTVESDSYDITQEVGYRYSDSPVKNATATIDDNVGEPSVDVTYEQHVLGFEFHNMKGEPGEKGDQGIQGIPGDSAIFDPETGNISTMKQTTGNSIVSPMSQEAVTKEFCSSFDELDLASYTTIAKTYIALDGTYKWKVQSSNTNNCKMIPIQDGWKALKIVSYYADDVEMAYHVEFLSSTEPGANNTSAAIVGEPRGEKTMAEDEAIIVIPEGATCVYVRNARADIGRILPQSISVSTGLTGLKTTMENEMQQVAEQVAESMKNELMEGVEGNYLVDRGINSIGKIIAWEGRCAYEPNTIRVSQGDTIIWTFGKNVGNMYLRVYNEDGAKIGGITATGTSNTKTLTVESESAYYLNCSFSPTLQDGTTPNTCPIVVNETLYEIAEHIPSLNSIEAEVLSLQDFYPTEDYDHGTVGESFPSEVREIDKYIGKIANNRLLFIHVSDNHNVVSSSLNYYGHKYACEFLEYCNAKFLINTGDLVQDKFTDTAEHTLNEACSAVKPVYLVMGNHDYSHAPSRQDLFDYFYGDPDDDGGEEGRESINHHNQRLGGTVADKTYYSVDCTTEKVKCIILDLNEGWPADNIPALSSLASGKMSQTQINWFISQLQEASTNGYHVCAFIHWACDSLDPARVVVDFTDIANVDHNVLSILPKIVNAFINGTSFSETFDGNTYTGTFAKKGCFVSWFCGHTHYDAVGWLKDYPQQFSVTTMRPDAFGSYGGVVKEGENLHVNLVAIDTKQKSMSVYRIGQQKTFFGIDRKCFRVFYNIPEDEDDPTVL